MNRDENRLKEIQELKRAYTILGVEAETIGETLEYADKLEELDKEETEILKRCDVIT